MTGERVDAHDEHNRKDETDRVRFLLGCFFSRCRGGVVVSKMRALIYKPGLNDGSQGEMPHIGMGILAAEFKRVGVDAIIVDEHFHKRPSLPVSSSDIVAFSLASYEWPLPETQEVINYAHDLGKEVWIGGPHAHGYWDILANDKRITKIVVGEVDGQIEEVLDKKAKIISLPAPPLLDTPNYNLMTFVREIVAYPIYLSRGCTNNCSFCAASQIHGKWRKRSVYDAIDEISQVET